MATLAILLLIALYLALASSRAVRALRRFTVHPWRGGLLIALLIVPYLLVVLPTANTDPIAFSGGLARMLAYLLVPGLALLWRPARKKPLDPFDVVAILALWLPVEFGWLPDAEAPLLAGLNLPLPLLTGVCLGFLLFLVIRPLEGLGYSFRFRHRDPGYAFLGLAAFALVGMPLGVTMGFIQLGVAPVDVGAWLLRCVAIYFLTALPEELLFRGVILNLIDQRLGRNTATLVLAAVLFGVSHLNNVTAFHAPPNWPYALMATFAGLAYGWVWRKSQKITASAITHTCVNFVWGVVFAS